MVDLLKASDFKSNYETIENNSSEKKYSKYEIDYPDYFRTDKNEKSLRYNRPS